MAKPPFAWVEVDASTLLQNVDRIEKVLLDNRAIAIAAWTVKAKQNVVTIKGRNLWQKFVAKFWFEPLYWYVQMIGYNDTNFESYAKKRWDYKSYLKDLEQLRSIAVSADQNGAKTVWLTDAMIWVLYDEFSESVISDMQSASSVNYYV